MLSDIVSPAPVEADGVRLETLPGFTRFNFRGDHAAADALGVAFGVTLPSEICRAAIAGDRAALCLGPDEWLLLALPDQGEALTAAAQSALGGQPHSLVEISDRQVALRLSGRHATTVLAGGNPLDLDLAAFQ